MQTPSLSACQSTRLCKWCDKPFSAKQTRVQYCNRRCNERGRKAEKANRTHCKTCGKETWKLSAGGTCSKKCSARKAGNGRRERHPKLDCLKCHGIVGLKCKESARLLRVSHKIVYENRRRLGLRVLTRKEANRNHAVRGGRARPHLWGIKNPSSIEEWQGWAYREDQKKWIEFESIACWSKEPTVRREMARLAYYRDHEASKERSRQNARKTYEKRKNDAKWMQKRKKHSHAWNKRNAGYKRKKHLEWRKSNPAKWRESKRRQAAKPINRILRNVRKRLRDVIRGKRNALNVVGCTRKQLQEHLQSQFTKQMHFNNYGTYWHVDHIVPVSHFDLTNPEHVKLVHHYTNLRPMEAVANMMRGNKIDQPIQIHLPL